MDVTSSPSTDIGSVQIDALKKSIDVPQRDVLKILESSAEQSKGISAQKTGIGSNLNITA
jgi:hypothetical protein